MSLAHIILSRKRFNGGQQGLDTVKDETEARKRGFPKGDTFKLLKQDFILIPEKQPTEFTARI